MPFRRAYPNVPEADILESLVSKRVVIGADQAAVDAEIWATFGQTWAVMFTDLSGFSRGVASFGVIHFLQIIHESYLLFLPCIDQHQGQLLKTEGDSLLVVFPKPQQALAAALAMQAATARYNQSATPAEQLLLCVGLGVGPMLKIGGVDVYGAEVNAASKLGEDLAQAGEILCTDTFKHAVAAPELAFVAVQNTPDWMVQAWQISIAE